MHGQRHLGGCLRSLSPLATKHDATAAYGSGRPGGITPVHFMQLNITKARTWRIPVF